MQRGRGRPRRTLVHLSEVGFERLVTAPQGGNHGRFHLEGPSSARLGLADQLTYDAELGLVHVSVGGRCRSYPVSTVSDMVLSVPDAEAAE